MQELEVETKQAAKKHIIATIKKHGKLEKIDQIKRKLIRQKTSVEAQLKSAMQQQLDGVNVGLNQLHSSQGDVAEIDASLKKMFELFKGVSGLYSKLNTVRDENMRHSQYVTAKENLKHIFTVPESVEKTKQWINESKLLHTHQCLRDLENSRDDLLYELHKLPNQSPHDKSMLKAYFMDVEELSNLLETQLRINLSLTLNSIRSNATVIVTALRIIEREEKADVEALKQQKQTGFLPPGRPKNWRKMAFDVLEKSVAARIEGTCLVERENDKNWLITHLERTAQMIMKDLNIVKDHCVPRFPPRYEIIDTYIKMYHRCLSNHLQEIIQSGLEGNEYVTMLQWTQQTYSTEQLLGHPDLKDYTKCVKDEPLLPKEVVQRLEDEYLNNMEKNYAEWMKNTLTSEMQEWRSATISQSGGVGPIIIYEMIDQNLQVTKTISEKLTHEALTRGIDNVIKYECSYRTAILEFKNTYFSDRKQLPYFTQHMILIVNNCLQLADFGSQFEKQYLTNSSSIREKFDILRTNFLKLRNNASLYLLEELFLDLEKHFEELFTSRWYEKSLQVDTICLTIEDYFQDYNGLAKSNFKFVVYQVRGKIVEKYLIALLSKRTSFKNYVDSVEAAARIVKEVKQLKDLLLKFCNDLEGEDPFEAIEFLAEVLRSTDDMVSFDLHRLVERYVDISDDHLLRLLHFRGDLTWSEVRERVAHLSRPSNHSSQPSIFKNLVFPKTLF